MSNQVLLAALGAAARRKGSPLTASEMAAVEKGCQREVLRLRFIAVIRGAGYKNDAPERICAEYLDEYMKDIPKFVAMLEDYEKNDFDPE